MAQAHDVPPRLDDLVGVARAEDEQSRDRTQRSQLLHRLVGRTVLAHADGVVREDVDDGDLHERGETHGAAGIVGEDQEPRPVRPQLRDCDAVGERGRGVLPHPEVEVSAGPRLALEIAGTLEDQTSLGRGRQIRGPADEPRHDLGQRVEHLAR